MPTCPRPSASGPLEVVAFLVGPPVRVSRQQTMTMPGYARVRTDNPTAYIRR
jgi:hypothetical protein